MAVFDADNEALMGGGIAISMEEEANIFKVYYV